MASQQGEISAAFDALELDESLQFAEEGWDAPSNAVLSPPPAVEDPGASSSDEMTCSICLQHTQLQEIACVKGCDHTYCVKCILRWAAHRERATCPQCKGPFDYVSTYYNLDGTLHDFPMEESVVLLKRARFFTDYMQTVDKGKWRLTAEDGSSEWRDYQPFYQEYDEDEEVEAFYFSSAAGRARVTIGNRRWGENGYVASGRMQARPVQRNQGKKKGIPAAGAAAAAAPSAASSCTPKSSGRRRRKGAANNPSPAAGAAATSASAMGSGGSAAPSAAAAAAPAPTTPPLAPSVARSQPIAMAGRAATPAAEDEGFQGCSPHTPGPYGTSLGPYGSSPGAWSSGSVGRRAKRNMRRAAADALTPE